MDARPRVTVSPAAPSLRPGEPLTAGIDAGPGPGSEALAANTAGAVEDWSRALDVADAARHLPTLELLASQPDATATLRAFVFRLRAAARASQSVDLEAMLPANPAVGVAQPGLGTGAPL